MNALFDMICESDIGSYKIDPHEDLVVHFPCVYGYADTWRVSGTYIQFQSPKRMVNTCLRNPNFFLRPTSSRCQGGLADTTMVPGKYPFSKMWEDQRHQLLDKLVTFLFRSLKDRTTVVVTYLQSW